jgi:hypothetical protein
MPLLEHHPGRALRVKGRHTWYVNIRSASQIADIFVGVVGMSAKGHKRTHTPQQKSWANNEALLHDRSQHACRIRPVRTGMGLLLQIHSPNDAQRLNGGTPVYRSQTHPMAPHFPLV